MSSDVRRHVLSRLSQPNADSRFFPAYFVTPVSQELGCPPHRVYEALWGLVGEGLAYLDPNGQGSGTDNWVWRLSEAGLSAAVGGQWEPRDIDGYLRRLRRHRPDVDAIAVTYVEEALRAYNSRCYLAASVMLGVASERVMELLAESVAAQVGPSAKKLADALSSPRTSFNTRFLELRKLLESIRSSLPDGLADTLTLDAIADLLRVTRNSVGHPTGATIDEDTAYTHLQMAARYLQKMTTLKAHFDVGAHAGSA